MVKNKYFNLSGWGRNIKASCQLINYDEKKFSENFPKSKLIPRGLGRAYGDSALQPKLTVSMTKHNKIIKFDRSKGIIKVQSGVSISQLLSLIVQHGWFMPVTPGSKNVTIGGMVASNVHGKNHYKSGTFSKYIEWIEIINHDGKIVRCSKTENTELFRWTIGGMGLTGIIINVAFYMNRIKTAWINQTKLVSKNINQTFEFFESNIDSTYSVAWIDCYSKGNNLGRSVLMLGEHAKVDEISSNKKLNPFKTSKKKKLSIPFFFPSFVLSNFSVKIFNSLNYIASKISGRNCIVDWDTFFYPLDKILNWNKIYGSKGFAQFQCVIPLSESKKGISEMLNLISNSKSSSFLAVLKRFGQDESHFSFPMEGYSLALDFPINKENLLLMNLLDEITIKYGGRFYLVKDSRMMKKIFESSDVRIKNFKAFRENKLNKKFTSCQSERLGL